MEGVPAKVTNLFLSVWALSSAWLFATLSMRFFQGRILEWVVISSSKGLPNPGIKPGSLVSLALQVDSFAAEPSRKYPHPKALETVSG